MAKRIGFAILIVASMYSTADAQRFYRRHVPPIIVPAYPVIAPPVIVQPYSYPFARGYYRPGVRAIRRSSTANVTFQLPGVIIGGPLAPVTYFTPPAYAGFYSAGVYYPPYGYPQYSAQYNQAFVNPYGSAYVPTQRRATVLPRRRNTLSPAQMQQVLSSAPATSPKVLPGQFQSTLSGNGIQPVAGQLPPSATQSLILQPTPNAEQPPPPSQPVSVAKPTKPKVPADPQPEAKETDIPPAPKSPEPGQAETDLPPVIPDNSDK